MSGIRDDDLEEVRARGDILAVVGAVVELKKAGKDYKGRCPFHEEKTPSFYVDPAKGLYHCFGCGKGGDAIKFAQEHLNLDFGEAVKHVGALSGIQVREQERGRPEEEDPRKPLFEALAFARGWFRERLLDPEVGRAARRYLEDRGIDPETAEDFGLGWAPNPRRDGSQTLLEAALALGIDLDVLLQLKLANSTERWPEPHDFFRDRVMFPIASETGRVVGFMGRVLQKDAKAMKYMNSAEGSTFSKGLTLFGLDRARYEIRGKEEVLLVEGNMDVVSLHAAGYKNCVAPMGTAVTEDQARMVKKYADRALLLFDADKSGQTATFKLADLLLAQGVEPLVVTLPPGEDPDSLVQGQGPDALRPYLAAAQDVLERKVAILEEKGLFETIRGRTLAKDKLIPTLAAVADPSRRDMYLALAAEKTHISRESLLEEVFAFREGPGRAQGASPRRDSRPPEVRRPTRARRLPPGTMGPEFNLLRILARDRQRREELLEWAGERVGPEDFKDGTNRAIFEAFLEEPELEAPPPAMEPHVAQRLDRLLAEPPREGELAHGEREFQAAVAALESARIGWEIDEVQRRIDAAPDDETKLELIQEKQRLLRERQSRGPVGGGDFARRLARGSDSHY